MSSEFPGAGAVLAACPECAVDLSDFDPRAHAIKHWGEALVDPRVGPEAAKRQKALLDLGRQRQRADEDRAAGASSSSAGRA